MGWLLEVSGARKGFILSLEVSGPLCKTEMAIGRRRGWSSHVWNLLLFYRKNDRNIELAVFLTPPVFKKKFFFWSFSIRKIKILMDPSQMTILFKIFFFK